MIKNQWLRNLRPGGKVIVRWGSGIINSEVKIVSKINTQTIELEDSSISYSLFSGLSIGSERWDEQVCLEEATPERLGKYRYKEMQQSVIIK